MKAIVFQIKETAECIPVARRSKFRVRVDYQEMVCSAQKMLSNENAGLPLELLHSGAWAPIWITALEDWSPRGNGCMGNQLIQPNQVESGNYATDFAS